MGIKKGTTLLTAKDRKVLKAIGQRIQEIRLNKRFTVYDVTGDDLLIKSRQHWQKIEAGQLSLTFVTFYKIALSLEVEPAELLAGI